MPAPIACPGIAFRPATQALFDDVAEMLGPKRRPDAQACWCIYTYPGLRSMFDKAGFNKVSDTLSTLGGTPRIVMRLETERR